MKFKFTGRFLLTENYNGEETMSFLVRSHFNFTLAGCDRFSQSSTSY